jgi:hypothetical protein
MPKRRTDALIEWLKKYCLPTDEYAKQKAIEELEKI